MLRSERYFPDQTDLLLPHPVAYTRAGQIEEPIHPMVALGPLARWHSLALIWIPVSFFLSPFPRQFGVVKLYNRQRLLHQRHKRTRLTPQALHKLLGPSGPRLHSAVTVTEHP